MPKYILDDVRNYNHQLHLLAWDRLKHSQFIEPSLNHQDGRRFGIPKFLLWLRALGWSSYQPHTYTVFVPIEDRSLVVRRAEWNRSRDLELTKDLLQILTADDRDRSQPVEWPELPEPFPTLKVQDAEIDEKEFDAMLGLASGIRLPIIWKWDQRSMIMDTETYGFEFFDGVETQTRLRFTFPSYLPSERRSVAEWHDVEEWFFQMLEWLENSFQTN